MKTYILIAIAGFITGLLTASYWGKSLLSLFRSKWILRNTYTGHLWVTGERFTKRELQKIMNQRKWNSEIVGKEV